MYVILALNYVDHPRPREYLDLEVTSFSITKKQTKKWFFTQGKTSLS